MFERERRVMSDASSESSPIRTKGEALREIHRDIQSHLSRLSLDEEDDVEEEDEIESEERESERRASVDGVEEVEFIVRAPSFGSADEVTSSSFPRGIAVVPISAEASRRVDQAHSSATTMSNARAQADAEMEIRLRRAELRKVDLELKLANSHEKVELARRALRDAEEVQTMYEIEFEDAVKEFEEQQGLVYDELEKREEEHKAAQIAAMQAAAILRADQWRRDADASFNRGEIGEAEQLYSHAIAELEVSGLALIQPSHLWLRVNRATALFTLGHVREALSECELVLKVDSSHIRALSRAAECCLHLNELEKAQRYIEFVSLSPNADSNDLKAALTQKRVLIRALVERDKLAGNDAFRSDNFVEAMRLYSSALENLNSVDLPDVVRVRVGLLSNRAAAWMMMGEAREGAEDCRAALELDELHFKARIRLGRCLLQQGHFEKALHEAFQVMNRGLSTSDHKLDAKQVIDDAALLKRIIEDTGEKLYQMEGAAAENRIVDDIMKQLDESLILAPHCAAIKIFKAEALRFSGDLDAAGKQLLGVNVDDNIRGLCVQIRIAFDLGMISFCMDTLERLKFFIPKLVSYAKRQSLDVLFESEDAQEYKTELEQIPNPVTLFQISNTVHQICELKCQGKDNFCNSNYAEAISAYTEALGLCKDSDTLQGLFLSNICACEQATKSYIDALASAGAACALAPTYIKAHTRLAAIYTELDMVIDAQKTYQALLRMDLTLEERINVESYLDHVRVRVQAEMPIDWRKLLGVEAKSSKDALKKKYRQLALKHHPDKASQGAASENLARARATVSSRLFNLINEAHNVLSNDNAVIKWENDRAKAKYKCCRPSGYPMHGRSTFGDTNRKEHYASTWD